MCLLHINIYMLCECHCPRCLFGNGCSKVSEVHLCSNNWLHGEINTHIRWYVFVVCGPAAPSWAWNQQCGKKQPLPFQSILQNTITVALLEVNLLPACSDEVHLIVHTNGPREAHKMIEQLCFGDEYWKLKLVSAYRNLSPTSVLIITLMHLFKMVNSQFAFRSLWCWRMMLFGKGCLCLL